MFGWFVEELIQVERLIAYSVNAGYQKRPSSLTQSLAFQTVTVDLNSAGEQTDS